MRFPTAPVAARCTVAGVVMLAILIALWELTLAPLRPGGSWLVLKGLPLLLVLPGVARGTRRARQWLALMLPWYCAEGIVRGLTEHGRYAVVAGAAATIAAATFVALLLWFRAERADSA